MVRFNFLRKGGGGHRRLGDDRPLRRRRANSGSSLIGSCDAFDPNHYTLDTTTTASTLAVDEGPVRLGRSNDPRMDEWFFPNNNDDINVVGGRPTQKKVAQSTSSRRAVQHLSRDPSDQGSTYGGKDIEELAELDTKVLALTPSEDSDGLINDYDNDREVPIVRPVVIRAVELRRQQASPEQPAKASEPEKLDLSSSSSNNNVTRGQTWGRRPSALDSMFGMKSAKREPPRPELSPETKIVRVVSVETPDFQDSSSKPRKGGYSHKTRVSWMKKKKTPPPVYKLEPQVDSKILKSKRSSGLDSSIASSAITGEYTTETSSSSGSSTAEAYSEEDRRYRRRSRKSSISVYSDEDDDEDVDDEGMMGSCSGCNPVGPCQFVANDISYFVSELMDQEIVVKDDSIFSKFMKSSSPSTNKKQKQRSKARKPSKKYSEVS